MFYKMEGEEEKMSEVGKRKKMHKILGLLMDINGVEESHCMPGEENGPIVFMEFHGHVGSLHIEVYKSGWEKDKVPDLLVNLYLKEDESELNEIIRRLEAIKEEVYGYEN